MPNDLPIPARAEQQVSEFVRRTRQCYTQANRASHHLLGAALKLTALAYFLFALVFLGVRYVVLPNIDHYKPQVEQIASNAVGQTVRIESLAASWEGLRPSLQLSGVVIHDRQGRPALQLPGVSATLSWWSLMVADLRLYSLEIRQPNVDIQRDAGGKLFVGGIFIDPNKKSDGRGAEWLLSQHEIVVRDGRVRWNDLQRGAPELELNGVTFVLRNQWRHHELTLKAVPPATFAGPIDIRAAFDHPHFASSIADVKRWKGQLYLDLQGADLAVWKPYVDYPFAIEKGSGSIRAWMNFDRARIADLTADLKLAHVSTRLRADLEPLRLTEVSGRISVREEFNDGSGVQIVRANQDGSPTFGAAGHAISLTDFSLRTDDGLTLPSTTISETYVPAQKGRPEKTEVTAKSLDLKTLAEFVERLPLPEAQHRMLVELEPRGQLKDFSAQWEGAYPHISSYKVHGDFMHLTLKAQPPRPARPKTAVSPAQAALPAIPGFENLSGRVDASQHGGSFKLASNGVKLNMPGYFNEPVMPFEKLNMQAAWTFTNKDQLLLDVSKMEFALPGIVANFSGKHLMPLTSQPGRPLGSIDLQGTIARFDLNKIGDYLPLATPAETRNWLVGALRGGTARDVSLRIKGELAQFPFAPNKAGVDPKSEFRVAGKIDNGELIYVPGAFARDGKAPLWPALEKINGTITFDKTRLEVQAKTAQTHGVAMSGVKAVIPDLLDPDIKVNIEGGAAGAMQDLLHYVRDSPVSNMIGHFTDDTRASGPGKLGLKLTLPLHRMLETRVQGVLQFEGNDVNLIADLPPLQGVAGKLEFNERGLTLNGVKATFLDGPLSVSGGTQRDDSIVIRGEGTANSSGLRKAYPSPVISKLADRIVGGARYTTVISVRKRRPEIVVESNLQGLALDFPAPLRKAATDALPLKFELGMLATDEGAPLRDELKLSLGTAISARYLRQRTGDAGGWRVLRGGIGVNVPAPQPDSGLVANVNLAALNIDAWTGAVAAITGGEGVRADAPAAPAADTLSIAQYIEPEVLAARATELIVAGKKLTNVVVGASRQRGVWQANIDSEQAAGYLSWNAAVDGQGVGRATARLSSLTIAKNSASEVSDLLEGKSSVKQIPALDIVADNFELFGKKMGRLELVADNVRASATREWRISKLSMVNDDAELKATGKWEFREGASMSNLNYTLSFANAGNLLARYGFPGAVRGGKGRMEGDLSWKDQPFSLDIPSLSGQFKLDVESGQFLKIDPGAAKLLAVLNLQALPRRLSLDFRDVFSEGFAFDGINGAATITNGVARTENFKMRSTSATVLIDGSADIARETQDLRVIVLPEINAGAASVVYALAVNPLIGVGTFLAQLFLREPLIRAFTFEYRITGPWSEPVVTKVDRRNQASAAAEPDKKTE